MTNDELNKQCKFLFKLYNGNFYNQEFISKIKEILPMGYDIDHGEQLFKILKYIDQINANDKYTLYGNTVTFNELLSRLFISCYKKYLNEPIVYKVMDFESLNIVTFKSGIKSLSDVAPWDNEKLNNKPMINNTSIYMYGTVYSKDYYITFDNKTFPIRLYDLKNVFVNDSFSVVTYEDGDSTKHNVHSIEIVEDYRTRHILNIYYKDTAEYSSIVDIEVIRNIDNV